jgi:hypothetical protein
MAFVHGYDFLEYYFGEFENKCKYVYMFYGLLMDGLY